MPDADHSHSDHVIACEAVLRLLSDYIDDELTQDQCDAIMAHAADCVPCRSFSEAFTKTIAIYREAPPDDVPSDVKIALAKALQQCREALPKG